MAVGGDQINRNKTFNVPTGIVDIMPTILHGLGVKIPATSMGRPLKEAFLGGGAEPTWYEKKLRESSTNYIQEMLVSHVTGVEFPYLRGGNRIV